MWVITTQGFYSAVAHRDEPDTVIVRARTRDDIEALRRQIPGIEPFEDATADYRHRAVVGRAEWVAAVAQLASAIDYDNFKDEVAERPGPGKGLALQPGVGCAAPASGPLNAE